MIRFGWNKKTLTARFVRVLCVTFLPLGILTFVAACLVVWFSSNQISASYEHSLEGDMIPLQENILETEEELDDFVLDHLAELAMERGHDEALNYEMIEELQHAEEPAGGGSGLSLRPQPGFHLCEI